MVNQDLKKVDIQADIRTLSPCQTHFAHFLSKVDLLADLKRLNSPPMSLQLHKAHNQVLYTSSYSQY